MTAAGETNGTGHGPEEPGSRPPGEAHAGGGEPDGGPSHEEAAGARFIEGGHTYSSITDHISSLVLRKKTPLGWYIGFGIGFALTLVLFVSLAELLLTGVGIWGNNIPVAWAFAIINFVWWIGIGHAGTLISAVLLLLRQEWRTSINRFAEAMTLFAVACAGIFPTFHTGRPWFDYWLLPYPNVMSMWPNFRSPLVWDVFAISTYGLMSFLFWFVGLLPDLATLRDRTPNRLAKVIYGILAMGWRGSARHWHRYQVAYLLLAGLATPLVVSVHTIVSFDFAVGIVPGWHATIFPPYFVAGAIYAGFAMVLTLGIPLRAAFGLKDFITDRHLDNMAKVMLTTGLIVVYGYSMEAFFGWYSGDKFEAYAIHNRQTGPYWWIYLLLMLCNGVMPQFLWSKRVRTSPIPLFIVAMFVNFGMWFERFVIVITSLHRDFLPSSWQMYYPTFWDLSTLFGSIGLFFALMFLFLRFLPVISISEMREMVPATSGRQRT
jgi:Ni/Fe-hydrogenase subunit HybB-like protein